MGICESSENLEQHEKHISHNNTANDGVKAMDKREDLAESIRCKEIKKSKEPKESNFAQQERRLTEQMDTIQEARDMIDKLNDNINGLNDKIEILQNDCNTFQLINDNLENELIDAREQVFKEQQKKEEERYKLNVAQDEINKISVEKEELNNKLMEISVINAQKEEIERNKMYSIRDVFNKVQGDSVSKLKYNKQSKKQIVFVNKINHLFYYDISGNNKSDQKVVKIRDILTNNYSIEKEINKPWFLIIGEKRSVLLVTESDSIRDKWVDFISSSIKNKDKDNNNNNTFNLSINTTNLLNEYDEESISKSPITPTFGLAQSPINIITSPKNSNTKIMREEEFESNPLKFNYPQKIKYCTISNNGHTVQINIDCKYNQCTLSIHDKIYKLKQFHFHAPSEHTIDSKQYEMEMHLVHINELSEIAVLAFIFSTGNKYLNKPELSYTKSRMHLVLSTDNNNDNILKKHTPKYGNTLNLKTMQESDEDTDDLETDLDDEYNEYNEYQDDEQKENDFLEQFWDQLPSKKTKKDLVLEKSISFDYLFETSSNNFIKSVKTNEINIDMEIFEYMGSLTTPPYTEGVQWLVSKKTHFIHYKQLEKLKKCWNNENNARPVQGYFGRTVSLRSKSSLSSNHLLSNQ